MATTANSVQKLFKQSIIYNSQDKQYDLFSDIFRTILDHHAPLKTNRIRGNQAKFMRKELSKSIINRSAYKKRKRVTLKRLQKT